MTQLDFILQILLQHLREGRVERSLALITAASGLISATEVAGEHYRGSFGQAVMYTPVLCCLLLALAALAVAIFPSASPLLFWASVILLLNGVIGFGFHIRGIARKPGGWRKNLIFNLVMGPPLFAPLLLGIGAVLGLVTVDLLPEESISVVAQETRARIRELLLLACASSAFLNGLEALYSHYKSRFASTSQWIPVVYAPILTAAAILYFYFPDRLCSEFLVASLFAIFVGTLGFFYHTRGIWRRARGKGNFFYGFIYGPPPFAPMLFAASGFLGLLAQQIGGPNG